MAAAAEDGCGAKLPEGLPAEERAVHEERKGVAMKDSSLSRRSFIMGGSLLGLGAAAGLAGCATPKKDGDETSASAEEPGADASAGGRGVVKADSTQAGYADDVTVSLTVDTDTGKVTEVSVEGPMETPNKGGRAIRVMQQAMLDAQSVDVDCVAGATITASAVLSAAKEAYGKAMIGEGLRQRKMKPGTYTASAKSGFWRIIDLPVTVTVNEDAILNIKTPEDRFEHGETEVVMQSVIDRFFPRVIANQSINVDTVSGATQSCLGVRNAMRKALEQAFEAAGEPACAEAKFEEPVDLKVEAGQVEEIEADVLVVGLGNGGVFAMRSALEEFQNRTAGSLGNLAKIVGIDRAGRIGGKSSMTHESFMVNPTRYAEVFNGGTPYADTEDVLAAYMDYCTQDGKMVGKAECIESYIRNSGDTVDWLFSHGWHYGTTPATKEKAPYGAPNSCNFNNLNSSRLDPGTYEDRRKMVVGWLESMVNEVVSQGGRVLLETEGYEIMTEGGAVTGVKARNLVTGKEYVIHAKSVIMNTGGFSHNYEMMNELLDEQWRGFYKCIGFSQDTGAMIQAARNVGANLFNAGMPIAMHFGTDHWLEMFDDFKPLEKLQYRTGRYNVQTMNNIPMGVAGDATCIAVGGKTSKRFMDEKNHTNFAAGTQDEPFTHYKGGAVYYMIASKDVLDVIMNEGFNTTSFDGYNSQGTIVKETPIPALYEALDQAIVEEMAFKADTIADLAKQCGLDEKVLVETVDSYNAMCDAGEDTEFGKAPEFLKKLVTGPFYAIKIHQATFGTIGALEVDKDWTVIDTNGDQIRGLYAIGLDSMGVIHCPNRTYNGFGGTAQGWLHTGGRMAGKNAVAYVDETYGLSFAPYKLGDVEDGF